MSYGLASRVMALQFKQRALQAAAAAARRTRVSTLDILVRACSIQATFDPSAAPSDEQRRRARIVHLIGIAEQRRDAAFRDLA